MFVSFFPQPKLFFSSAIAWSVVVVLFWFFVGEQMGAWFGLPPAAADAPPIIGITVFWSKPFLWFYLYFAAAVLAFYSFWSRYSPHPWQNWSILGSALILFITYFQVQVSVAVNNWYGPFWDYVQGDHVEDRDDDQRRILLAVEQLRLAGPGGHECRACSPPSSSATGSSAGAPP